MNPQEEKNAINTEERITSNPIKRSFSQTLKSVEAQVEIFALPRPKQLKGKELCMIIAEVMRLPPDSLIRVDGDDKEASEVAEIYKMLNYSHIESVIDNVNSTKYRIRAMKTYLRTALYNSVFTLENSLDNEVNSEI